METNRNNIGALIAGAILIGVGLLTLVSRFYSGIDWAFLWPTAIIGFGALFFVAMFASGKNSAALAIPGTLISGIGLVVLFQNMTRHVQMMSYMWTLIILFVGLGMYIMGWYGEDANQRKAGSRVMKIGLILLIIFGTIFESLFSSSRNLIFPLLLILLGGYLVVSRSGLLERNQDQPADRPLPPTS